MTTADVHVATAHGAEQLGVHHLRDGVVGRGVLRWAFLLTVAPLIVVGATASPVNPIAVL
jgi:hypothetical protein